MVERRGADRHRGGDASGAELRFVPTAEGGALALWSRGRTRSWGRAFGRGGRSDTSNRDGPRAIALYSGTHGLFSSAAPLLISWIRAIGSPNYFTPNTIDQPSQSTAWARHGSWDAGVNRFEDLRGNDVILLAHHFLGIFNRKFKRRFERIAPEAEHLLRAYPWPGNVRELQNVVERLVLLEDAGDVRPEMLPPEIVMGVDAAVEKMLSLSQVEEDHILRVLQATAWNKSRAARILGISRQSLLDRLKRSQLVEPQRERSGVRV